MFYFVCTLCFLLLGWGIGASCALYQAKKTLSEIEQENDRAERERFLERHIVNLVRSDIHSAVAHHYDVCHAQNDEDTVL